MKISLVVPTYNSSQYLRDSLTSATTQEKYKFHEIILVDDGSTDSPEKVARAVKADIVCVRHEKSRGVSAARNAGAKVATGDYLAFLDADDVLVPQYLEKMTGLIDEKNLLCCGCWLRYMASPTRLGGIIKTFPTVGQNATRPSTFPSGFIIRKVFFDRLGGFAECLTTAEDSEFFLRIYSGGVTVYSLAEPLVGYRINPGSITSTGKEKKLFFMDLLDLIDQKGVDISLESFESIYAMRSRGDACPSPWSDNSNFRAIYEKEYAWRNLVLLRRIYALWLDRKFIRCFFEAIKGVVRHPGMITNRDFRRAAIAKAGRMLRSSRSK